MRSASDLIQMQSDIRDIELQFLSELKKLVGTTFKCKRNRLVTWEQDKVDVIDWEIANYDPIESSSRFGVRERK